MMNLLRYFVPNLLFVQHVKEKTNPTTFKVSVLFVRNQASIANGGRNPKEVPALSVSFASYDIAGHHLFQLLCSALRIQKFKKEDNALTTTTMMIARAKSSEYNLVNCEE
jgi:hypothetical protein